MAETLSFIVFGWNAKYYNFGIMTSLVSQTQTGASLDSSQEKYVEGQNGSVSLTLSENGYER